MSFFSSIMSGLTGATNNPPSNAAAAPYGSKSKTSVNNQDKKTQIVATERFVKGPSESLMNINTGRGNIENIYKFELNITINDSANGSGNGNGAESTTTDNSKEAVNTTSETDKK